MKIHFQPSPTPSAQQAFQELTRRYGQTASPDDADVIVVLGGDGSTLHSLQDAIRFKKPVFSLNLGHVGFLGNLYREGEDLITRIQNAETIKLSPLHIKATFLNGNIKDDFAINEVHVCNHNRAEGIYLQIIIDGKERVPRLGADGLIISTSVGSTGYNKSARGPILPLGDDIIALTPNNAFAPDRMRASVIRPRPITVGVVDPALRKVDVYADNHLIGETVKEVLVHLDTEQPYQLLFDPGYSLHEKIMRSQFSHQGTPQP